MFRNEHFRFYSRYTPYAFTEQSVYMQMKLYLYDVIDIKKETSNLFQSKDLTQ